VSQRSEELDNIENSNQLAKPAADEGWNEVKSDQDSSTVSKAYSELSNEKPTKRRSQRGKHRQAEDQRRPPKPKKPFQQGSFIRNQSGHARMAPKLTLSKSLRSPYSKTQKWGMKTRHGQHRPLTCPSGVSRFTFGSPKARTATKNWSQLIWESRFRKDVSDIQHAMDRQSDTPKSYRGYDCPTPNMWMKPPSSETWGHSPKNMPSRLSPHYGMEGRHHFMDMLGGMQMPITPPSPMSPLRPLDTSLGVMEYIAGLNKIDTSPKNPDAVVMNTPNGQFVRRSCGKWFPVAQNRSREYEEAVLQDAREKTKKADRDFGNWCKQRQARSEFVAAITKAAADPTVVEGAVE